MDNIIHEIHKKLDIHPEDILQVVKSAEYFLAKQIASDEFKNIRVPGLGLFYIENKALEKIEKLNLKNKNNENI